MNVPGETWRLACIALAKLVREEYPSDLSLVEIADTWGGSISDESLAALNAVAEEIEENL